jgi:hypothetical protein
VTSAPVRLAAFAAVLCALFGAAYAVGAVLGPDRTEPVLRLESRSTSLPAAATSTLAFRVTADGRVVRDFELAHERRLHLIVVRRDLTGFQHLHPAMAPDGTWSTPIRLAAPGSYRAFADFRTRGRPHVLTAELSAPGRAAPVALPAPAPTARTSTGYDVRLALAAGRATFTVRRDGKPVRDLQPYLGARGHLVAIHAGDLAYLHVHPISQPTPGADIRFAVAAPATGSSRLFLQFRHAGRVHTAAFTIGPGASEEEHGHGHGG